MAEHRQNALLDTGRDGVFKAVRLFVDVCPVDPEDIDQEPLREPVPADHRFRARVAKVRQHNLLLGRDRDQPVPGHSTERRGHGWGCDIERLGESGGDDCLPLLRHRVDVEQVIFDRPGRPSFAHPYSSFHRLTRWGRHARRPRSALAARTRGPYVGGSRRRPTRRPAGRSPHTRPQQPRGSGPVSGSCR